MVIIAKDENDENIEIFNFADDSEDELDQTLYKIFKDNLRFTIQTNLLYLKISFLKTLSVNRMAL